MNTRTRLMITAGTLLAASAAHGQVTYNNGGSHVVDSLINQYIEIADGPGSTPTTVMFNTGANITGTDGWDDTVYTLDNSKAIINDGTFVNDVSAYNSSMIEIYGGNLLDDIYTFSDATVRFHGGTLAENVDMYDSSTFYLQGGNVGEDVYVDNSATAYLSSGTINDDVVAYSSGTVHLSGATVGDDIEVNGSGKVYITGGSINEDIEIFNSNFGGGLVDISGGQLAAGGLGNLDVGFGVGRRGLLILRGSSFLVNGIAVGSGFVLPNSGVLSGTLLDGSTFTNIPFDRVGGSNRGKIELIVTEAVTIPTPMGASMAMVGLAGIAARRRRN